MSENIAVCDTLIIGAGSAGLEAYKAATANGAKCILVESGPLGTGTRRTGDTPVSALMSAAKRARAFYELDCFGMHAHCDRFLDTDNVLNQVRALRAKETSEILSYIYGMPEECRLLGKARFIDEHLVQINDLTQVKFETAVIATGASTMIPFELSQYRIHGGVYTPAEIFEQDHLPNSLAILGSSRSGLQLGQALSYFGVKVVVFGTRQLWRLTDESVLDTAIEMFQKRFDLELDCSTTAIERDATGFGLYYLDSHQYENFVSVENIMAATTRFPKTEGLNLREFGIRINRQGGIDVDPVTMQSSLPHIYAAGEVVSPDLTIAQAQEAGRRAGHNATCASGDIFTEKSEQVRLDVLYTEPELAVVGMSHEEVKKSSRNGHGFVSCEVKADRGMYRLTHNTGGILRVYCDETTHAIVGAEMCLANAGHIAHYLALVIQQKMPVEQICKMSFFIPGFEEIILRACTMAQKIFERKQNS